MHEDEMLSIQYGSSSNEILLLYVDNFDSSLTKLTI